MKHLIALAAVAAFTAFAEPIDWRHAREVSPGVRIAEISLAEPRLIRAHMMRIDLSARTWRFAETGRAEGYGLPMPDYTNSVRLIRTRRETTRDFMLGERSRGRDMIVALNSAPWSPFCPPWNHRFADPAGINIEHGEIITTNRTTGAVFTIDRSGAMSFVRDIPAERLGAYEYAVSGFQIILEDGRDLTGPGDVSVHPRMAFGLSKDRRYFFALAVDGRQPDWSIGATCREMVPMMLDAGASDAANMDGGGSTTMLYWDEEASAPVMVNRHDPDRRSMRANAINVGFIAE